MPLLRSLRAHPGASTALAGLAAVGTGTVALGAAEAADAGDPRLTVPVLVVLALVLTPAAANLIRERRDEIVVARLRGVGPVSLGLGAAAGPVLLALLGGIVGGAAALAAVATVEGEGPLTSATVVMGVALGVAGTAAAAGALWPLREPLAAMLRPPARRPSAGPQSGAVALLTVLATLLAYRTAASGRLDVLAYLGPALWAMLVVQVFVAVATRVASRRPEVADDAPGPSLLRPAGTLAVRRLLSPEHAGRLRLVVVTAAVAGTAWAGTAQADAWADDSARLRAGAPRSIALEDATPVAALELTRRLDPDGRWLLAAAADRSSIESSRRSAWLDLSRYDAVVAAFLEGTPGDLTARLEALGAGTVEPSGTGELTISAEASSLRGRVTVTAALVSAEGFLTQVEARLTRRQPEAVVTPPDCATACVPVSVTADADVVLTRVTFADRPLAGGSADLRTGVAHTLAPTDPVPVLAAGELGRDDAGTTVTPLLDGAARPVAVVGRVEGLPLLEGAGTVGDLGIALQRSGPSAAGLEVLVLARADTPADLLDALAQEAGLPDATVRDLPGRSATLGQAATDDAAARQALAGGTALLGLAALLGAALRHRPRLAHEDAVLRLVGLPAVERSRAGLLEAAGSAAAAAGATAVTLALTTLTTGQVLALVPAGAQRLGAPPAMDAGQLAVVTVAAATVAALGALTRTTRPRRNRPADLLDGGHR